MVTASFFVRGTPAPKGSTRAFVVAGRAVTTNANKNTAPWERIVAVEAMSHFRDAPTDVPVEVTLGFRLLRPKGHFGARGVKPQAPKAPAKKPDLDKLVRCVLDALTGVVWVDDSQVVEVVATKKFSLEPGVQIDVKPYVEVATW